MRALITAAVTTVRREGKRALTTPAQTRKLEEPIAIISVLTLPAMVIAVSCVQFQYKLFRWGVTTLLHVAVAIICMFNGPKHAVIKEMDT